MVIGAEMPDTNTAVAFKTDNDTPGGEPNTSQEATPTNGALPFSITLVVHPMSRNEGTSGAVGRMGE